MHCSKLHMLQKPLEPQLQWFQRPPAATVREQGSGASVCQSEDGVRPTTPIGPFGPFRRTASPFPSRHGILPAWPYGAADLIVLWLESTFQGGLPLKNYILLTGAVICFYSFAQKKIYILRGAIINYPLAGIIACYGTTTSSDYHRHTSHAN